MAKWMWIIAGPNGAGKSGFAETFLKNLGNHGLVKLNADERTLELRKQFPDDPPNQLNLKAAIAVDAEVDNCIKAGQSFVVKTVLSTGKYRDDVTKAKARGFKFGLIYISLYPPELSPLRVSERKPVLLASRKNGEPLNYLAPGINPSVDLALADSFK